MKYSVRQAKIPKVESNIGKTPGSLRYQAGCPRQQDEILAMRNVALTGNLEPTAR